MERRPTHALLLAEALLLALVAGAAVAQSANVGTAVDAACTTPAAPGEFLIVKVMAIPDQTYLDFLADFRTKGGLQVGAAEISSAGWVAPPAWRYLQGPQDAGFAYIMKPSGVFYVDTSASLNDFDYGLVIERSLGNSPAVGEDAGIGLVLPPLGGNYSVDVDGAGPAAATPYPVRLGDAVQVAFAVPPEVSRWVAPSTCDVGGRVADPLTGAGHIVGFNAYRVADSGALLPPPFAAFAGSWQAFLPFAPRMRNLTVTPCGTDTIVDLAGVAGLSGLRDNDARPYSGDELMFFHDGPTNGDGSPRDSGTPPLTGQLYWYAFQPVIGQRAGETIADLDGVSLTLSLALSIAVVDTPDGAATGADLDGDGTADLYSPQARIGIGGLGLTAESRPFLSTPVIGGIDPVAPCGGGGGCPPLQCGIVSVLPPEACEGTLQELAVAVTGGLPSYSVEWDLDGDTAPDAPGNPVFVTLPAGRHDVTAFVTDACASPGPQSCSSATSVQVNAAAAALVEVSGAGGGPLLVRDHGDVLEVDSQPAALAYNVYADLLPARNPDPRLDRLAGVWYDPGPASVLACSVTTWTDLGAGRIDLDVPLSAGTWFVVTASNRCGESVTGVDSDGVEHRVIGTFDDCGPSP